MDLTTICRGCAHLMKHQMFKTLNTHRALHTSLTVLRKKVKEEKPVIQYIGEHHKKARRIYLWGNTKTGALGL